MKTVLQSKDWKEYLKKEDFKNKTQVELYKTSYKYCAIYKIGEYYFTFGIPKGYKNLKNLKALIK